MMRVAVVVAAVLGMTTLTVHEAAALSARNRLCVQTARRTARAALQAARAAATAQQRAGIIACFGPDNSPTNACAANCTSTQTTCLDNQVTAPRAVCDTSNDPNDNVTSCRESFDADILACRGLKKPGTDEPDFDGQIACQTKARSDRFFCSQGCAAQVQPAQDQCGVDFADCLELCG
jgi:type II secretory pathway pseudopilin PulG